MRSLDTSSFTPLIYYRPKDTQMKNLQVVEAVVVNNQNIEFKSDGANVYTDSLTVAKVFNKRHDHVLRDIDNQIEALKSRSLILGNENLDGYVKNTYIDNRGKTYRMYYLTRDQFTFLVMGFTGAKALAWKIEYISAFNKIVESHQKIAIDNTNLKEDITNLKEDNIHLKEELNILKEKSHRLLPIVRKELDGVRRDNFEKVLKFFLDNGKNAGHFEAFKTRVYESIHTLIVGTVASNILLERFEQGLKSHNTSHKQPYLSDYLIALNYYSKEELASFDSVYQEIFRDISIAIDENPKLTPDIIRATVDMKLSAKILERRNISKGGSIQRKSRVDLDNLVEKTVQGILPKNEFYDRGSMLKRGRAFVV